MGSYFAVDPQADEAFVATMLSRLPNVVDLISDEHVVKGAFARAGLIAGHAGGHTITQPLLIAESGVPTWFDGMDPVSKDFTPGLTEAEYTWSWVSHPTRMEYTTRWKNDGASRIMSIEEARFKQARKTLINDLADKFVNGTGGRQPNGLANAIEDAAVGLQSEVVGGIDKAVHQWWNNQRRQKATGEHFGDDVGPGSGGPFLARGVLVAMQGYLDCLIGTHGPRWLFCTKSMGENFLRAMSLSFGLRATGRMDETADITPHSVTIFGKPVVPTPEMPADTGLWITADNASNPGFQNRTAPSELGEINARDLGGVYSIYHPDVNMTLDGPRVAGSQHVEWMFILHSCALIYENMAQQCRLSSADGDCWDDWA